jgi:CRISPR-associated protein Cas8a1/Csx13
VSIHTALRQRFGAIWEETKTLPKQTRDNRMQGERERWRLAFAKAKTADQTRGALADLWSRAGTNKELRDHWQDILPLLKSNEWARVRDLALVALASYRGKTEEEAEETPLEESTDEGN